MAQTTIKIKCTDQKLDAIEAPIVASGGFNENKVHFEFCPLWDNFTKTATFYVKKNEVYTAAVDSSGTCIVPNEVTANPGNMFFGVFGVKQDGTTRTSEVIKYKIVQGAITEDAKPSDPTPDVYEQILAKVAALDYHGHSIADVNGLQVELDGKSENGVEETDSSSAYVKSVPATAANYAKVNKIGGVTRKCTNLLPYPYDDTTHTVNGITFVDNGDGTITANGTATENATYFMKNNSLSLSAGKYTISGLPFDGGWTTAITQLASSNGFAFNNFLAQGETFTLDSEVNDMIVVLVVFKGYTANNLVFKPMLNEGSTALPYEPYFEGLRSAPVTEVESVGVNLFDPASIGTKTFIGLTYTTENGYVKINGTKVNGANIHPMTKPNITLPAGTYTVSVRMISGTVSGIEGSGGVFFGINQNSYGQRTTPGVSKVGDVGVRTFTLSEPTLISSFDIAPDYGSVGAVFDNAVFACQFEQAATATDFKPYTHNTLPIPEAVQALDGYGDGVNESVYNYIDLETKQFVKRVGKVVFDGSADESWEVRQYTNLVAYLASEEFGKIPNIVLCDRFESFIDMSPRPNGTVGIAVEGLSATAHTFFFGVSGIATNVAEWRAYLAANPITVYYELATPVVTDISIGDTLPLEAGGTLTMVNEHGYDVPNDITFYTNANDSYLGAKGFVGNLIGTAARAECDSDGNSIKETYAPKKHTHSFNDLADKPEITTYTISKDGNLIILKGSDGSVSSVVDATGSGGAGAATFTLVKRGSKISLEGSDGSYSEVEDDNTTYTKDQLGLGNVDNTADADKSVKHAISADRATNANAATKATQDGVGNNIVTTYSTKNELNTALNNIATTYATKGEVIGGTVVDITSAVSVSGAMGENPIAKAVDTGSSILILFAGEQSFSDISLTVPESLQSKLVVSAVIDGTKDCAASCGLIGSDLGSFSSTYADYGTSLEIKYV